MLLSLPRNLAFGTFSELQIVFSAKVNLLYLHYSTTWRCCLLHLIKKNCLLKTFLRTLILMTVEFLYIYTCFPFRTNQELHNISVTPKMIKKVIMNLNSSKVSGCDCIPVVVFQIARRFCWWSLYLRGKINC